MVKAPSVTQPSPDGGEASQGAGAGPAAAGDLKGNRKGIYALESNDYKRASGLTTLWHDGDAIGGNNCCELAKEIYFWELK